MTLNHRIIKCKSCAKTLAHVSNAGFVPSHPATDTESCDTCRQFHNLYNAMQGADKDYASFKDRRDTYGPKKEALAAFRQRRIEFHNWLMQTDKVYEELQQGLRVSSTEPKNVPNGSEKLPHGMKRCHSPSQSPQHDTLLQDPSPKDGHSTNLLPEQKRLKFADSVEFRKDYRPSQCYARSDEAYVQGRYAPHEGSKHLDTSGCSKTALQFTGTKKIGHKWVNVWTGDSDDDDEKSKAKVTRANNVSRTDDGTTDALSSPGKNAAEPSIDRTDARTDRLARRNDATTAKLWRTSMERKIQHEQIESEYLFKVKNAFGSTSQPMQRFEAVIREYADPQVNAVESKAEVEAEEKCFPCDLSNKNLDIEEMQPHTNTGPSVVREQLVEREEDTGAPVNEYFDRHDHAAD
jgi:hypothetical protein